MQVAHFLTARRFSDSAVAADDDVDIKVGTLQFFNGGKQGFGYILPDGVDKLNHEAKPCLYFYHLYRRVEETTELTICRMKSNSRKQKTFSSR